MRVSQSPKQVSNQSPRQSFVKLSSHQFQREIDQPGIRTAVENLRRSHAKISDALTYAQSHVAGAKDYLAVKAPIKFFADTVSQAKTTLVEQYGKNQNQHIIHGLSQIEKLDEAASKLTGLVAKYGNYHDIKFEAPPIFENVKSHLNTMLPLSYGNALGQIKSLEVKALSEARNIGHALRNAEYPSDIAEVFRSVQRNVGEPLAQWEDNIKRSQTYDPGVLHLVEMQSYKNTQSILNKVDNLHRYMQSQNYRPLRGAMSSEAYTAGAKQLMEHVVKAAI